MTYYGIYKITNLLNGKMYIGKHKTDNLDDDYMGSGLLLKRSMKKHGIENFRKEWMMFCEDEDEMNYMERVFVDQTWVDRADTYNLRLGGEGGSMKGAQKSEEWKKKQSASQKGKPSQFKGKHHTEESLKKMSEAASKRVGKKNPMFGKHHSEESINKMSKSKKGKYVLKVLQCSKDGIFIREWSSIVEAQTTLKIGNISRCCKGKLKSAGGFVWKYKN